jgi:hypothetical protein
MLPLGLFEPVQLALKPELAPEDIPINPPSSCQLVQ